MPWPPKGIELAFTYKTSEAVIRNFKNLNTDDNQREILLKDDFITLSPEWNVVTVNTAVNAFNKYLTQKTTQEGTGFSATTDLHIPYRSFGISFMYKFGIVKTKQKEDNDLLTKPPVEN